MASILSRPQWVNAKTDFDIVLLHKHLNKRIKTNCCIYLLNFHFTSFLQSGTGCLNSPLRKITINMFILYDQYSKIFQLLDQGPDLKEWTHWSLVVHTCIGPSMVQVMADHPFAAKRLPKLMSTYKQLNPQEHILVKFASKYNNFHSTKSARKCCL